ncbi:helix-turn-helix domain-containing protein [Bradyrhizobium prioriisuperbiae]|uniref:winged helix-turn-helix transcriptional regulator n=1 Tax=Bradyrhizobium prioriisuperbiae TaxID=2854389 RepID=UPI0028EFBC9F|nr:helix-turn-helix domain-containing protein [Bradyrhizobium prioritasuperba]
MSAHRKTNGTKAVRGSKSGRPIMALLDLLGRRWTLRIIWELRDHALTSRALRQACDDASPTVLQARLGDLKTAGLVESVPAEGYCLTAAGRELLGAFAPLNAFAEQWSVKSGRRQRTATKVASGRGKSA